MSLQSVTKLSARCLKTASCLLGINRAGYHHQIVLIDVTYSKFFILLPCEGEIFLAPHLE